MPRREKGFSISFDAYKELEYFCYQYGEKKQELAGLYGAEAGKIASMGKSGRVSDPTAQKAMRAMALQAELTAIEEAAKEAGREMAPFLMKNVTEKVKYEYMAVPCGRRQFYEMRRLFFEILYQKKKKIEIG